MAMNGNEKELVAVAISVAAGCKPCTDYHVEAVRKVGATDDEIRQAVADALAVRESATAIMKAYALACLGESKQQGKAKQARETRRLKELVSIGAAFGVNCVSNLEDHLAAARAMGISHEDIARVIRLAAYIKKRAAAHVERLAGMTQEAA